MTKPERSILIIAVSVVALVVAAIVIVLVVSPAETTFLPGSPEDVFQHYLTSYGNRDFTTAYGFFSSQARQQLSLSDYTAYARSGYGFEITPNSRIVVTSVTGSETSKTLVVNVESSSGQDLSISHVSYDVSVPLVNESGNWKIDQLLLGTTPAPVKPQAP